MEKHIDLSKYIPDYNPNEKLSPIAEILCGLNFKEWQLLKEVIDDVFELKVAKTELDDSDELKQRLEFEFSGINKAQKCILLSALNKRISRL